MPEGSAAQQAAALLPGSDVASLPSFMISPPIGIIVFELHVMAREIKLSAIYRGVTPFILADLILLVALTLAPSLATWLPHILK